MARQVLKNITHRFVTTVVKPCIYWHITGNAQITINDLYNLLLDLKEQLLEVKRFRPELKKQYYHVTELSYLTGMSVRALKGRRERGQIKMINDGNEVLIHTSEVEKFLKRLRNNL